MSLAETAELAVLLKLKDELTGPLNRVQSRLKELDAGTTKVTTSTNRLSGGLAGAFNGINRSLGGFQKNMGKAFSDLGTGLNKASQNLQKVGLAATGLAVGAGVAAVKWAGDFEAQMHTINTVAGLTPSALDKVGHHLRDIARETGVSLDDITSGYYDLVSAGVKGALAQETLNDAIKLGIGGLATTGESIDLLTTAINAYGLDVKGAALATDQFALAVADGKVKASEIAASFSNIASLAKTYHVGIDQISASYAFLTAQGVAGAEVTTQMQRAIISLIKPLPALAEAQKKLKINFTEEIQKKGLVPALQELRVYSDKTKIPLIELLGRVEAVKYTLATTGPNFANYNAELAKMGHASGTAAAQMAERQQGLNYQLNVLKANVRDAGITIGSALLPKLTPLIAQLNSLIQGHQTDISRFGDSLASAFQDVAKWVSKLDFHQIGNDLRVAGQFAKGLVDAFLAAPPWLQQAVITGWGLNKLTGGAVGSIFGDLAKGVVGGLAGQLGGLLSRGGNPGNPLFVADVAGGLGKGLPGGGGLSGLAKVALIGEAIGLVAAVEGVREQLSSDNSKFAGAIADQTKQYLAQNPSKADLENSLGAIDKGISDLRANPLNVLVQGDALDKLTAMRADVAAQLALFHTRAQASTAGHEFDAGANQEFNDQSPAMVKAVTGLANFIRDQRERPDGVNATKLVAARVDALTAVFRADLAKLIGATKDNDVRKIAGKITDALVKGRQGDPTLVSTQHRLSELKDAVKALQTKKLHTHDPETARILGNDIAKLNRKIADRELVLRQFQKEQAILASSESTSRKLTDLTTIQRYLKNTGHPHAAATVAKAIADMKARLAQTTARAGEVAAAAIRKKKQLVDVNVSNTVHVTTNVSARQIRTAEVVVRRYGNTSVGWT